jgi:hypothetical protein
MSNQAKGNAEVVIHQIGDLLRFRIHNRRGDYK